MNATFTLTPDWIDAEVRRYWDERVAWVDRWQLEHPDATPEEAKAAREEKFGTEEEEAAALTAMHKRMYERLQHYLGSLSPVEAWTYLHSRENAVPHCADLDFVEHATKYRGIRKSDARKLIDSLRKKAASSQVLPQLPQTVAQVEAETEPISFVVDGLLMAGGTTLLVAPPKQGKSTLAKQLAVAVAKGETVLNRNVKHGAVLYYQMEEHKAWTSSTLRTMGLGDDDPLLLVFERPNQGRSIETLRATLRQHPGTALLVLDMMAKVVNVDDLNDYAQVTAQLEPLTKLARETGVSILLLHHSRKDATGDPINVALGSTALTGNVDIIAGLSRVGELTYLSTSSRVCTPLQNLGLAWDADRLSYRVATSQEQQAASKRKQFDHGGYRTSHPYLVKFWENVMYSDERAQMWEPWANDPITCYEWILRNLGERPPSPKRGQERSIQRFDNDGMYHPDNIEKRWVPKGEQTSNRNSKNRPRGRLADGLP